MRDILETLLQWQAAGERIALATVIETWGSSPRQPGAKMALTASGKMCGSVSGGCVEGAVVEEGLTVLETNTSKLLHFGVADETAWEVGLACGGSMEVFVQPLDSALLMQVAELFKDNHSFALVTPLTASGQTRLEPDQAEPASASVIQNYLAAGKTGRAKLPTENSEVFIEALLPPPMLVVVGGVHVTIALVSLAKVLGFYTVVVDPRTAFGTAERFAQADKLVNEWPDDGLRQIGLTRNTAVAVLTHDPKLDDPGLLVALASEAFYVGALGSKTTQAKRRERLLAAGLTEAQLQRLYGPIGLDLGGRTPEEIALAILAQIVAARNGART